MKIWEEGWARRNKSVFLVRSGLEFFAMFCLLFVMASVSIGPFLIKNGETGLVASGFEHTGYSIELAGDKFSGNMRIYRRLNSWQPNAVGFDDFYVEADAIPFSVSLRKGIQAESKPCRGVRIICRSE